MSSRTCFGIYILYMKKSIINFIVIVITILITGCKSIPQEAYYSQDYITRYFAESDEDCSFIFEFINQSNRTLKLEGYISDTDKLINQYNPDITTSIFMVDAGECLTFKINADKLIKDFSKKYSIGINCIEKNWHWWQTINKGMKNNRFRIVVKNDQVEGGQLFNPPFTSADRFELKELSVDYEGRTYLSYHITETPDEYKNVFDTRVFYKNTSNNNGRVSNIFTCPCGDIIQQMLENGEFSIINVDGYKVLGLNIDPLDLNNYLEKDDQRCNFIYEIVNNASEKIAACNLLLDEEQKVLSLTNDIDLEPGQTYTYKYNLDTLEKIYGQKIQLCADIKSAAENKWIRGWFVTMDHKNDKYTVVVSDGTQGRTLDIFDLWTGFAQELEKGIMIY